LVEAIITASRHRHCAIIWSITISVLCLCTCTTDEWWRQAWASPQNVA